MPTSGPKCGALNTMPRPGSMSCNCSRPSTRMFLSSQGRHMSSHPRAQAHRWRNASRSRSPSSAGAADDGVHRRAAALQPLRVALHREPLTEVERCHRQRRGDESTQAGAGPKARDHPAPRHAAAGRGGHSSEGADLEDVVDRTHARKVRRKRPVRPRSGGTGDPNGVSPGRVSPARPTAGREVHERQLSEPLCHDVATVDGRGQQTGDLRSGGPSPTCRRRGRSPRTGAPARTAPRPCPGCPASPPGCRRTAP